MALHWLHSPTGHSTAESAVVKAFLVGGKTAGSANQPDAPNVWFGDEFVRPRFTPAYWMSLIEHSTRLKRCIEEIARSAVGLGVEAVPPPEYGPTIKKKRNLKLQVQRDMELLRRFIQKPNPSFEPLSEILYRVEYDYHGSGNGYMEVVEDERVAGAAVVSVDHVPCIGVRVNRTRDKLVRILGHSQTKIYFRRFGDEDPAHKYIDKTTGEFFAEWPADRPIHNRGTSIIHYKQYCPFDDYYGQPTVVSASNAVAGNKLVAIWNINFLKNNAHIPIAVVVENGNLSPDSIEQIELFTSRDGAGVQNAGKVMILQPDMTKLAVGGNLKIRIETLKMGITDDASFLEFKDSNNMEIQEAFGLSDIFIGGGGGTNSTTRNAATLRQLTQEHVVEPRTAYHENPLNVGIAPKIGEGLARFQVRRAANLDALQQAGVVGKLKDALTVNDVRRVAAKLIQDKELEPVDDELGDVPLAALSKVLDAMLRQKRQEALPVETLGSKATSGAGPTPTLKWLFQIH